MGELAEYFDNLPPAAEIREQIAANLRERQLLRRLHKLALSKEQAQSHDEPQEARRDD